MNAQHRVKQYHWDFFGPDARGTAEHFQHHLEEFLYANALAGCVTGVESRFSGHWSAWCKTPSALEETLERSLRPRRAVWSTLDVDEVLEV